METEPEVGTNIPEGWSTPPTLLDLKADFNSTKNSHSNEVSRRDEHLEHLHLSGSLKLKPVRGRSRVQPKTIRKHAEWRYAALSEAFLSTPELAKLSPRTHQDKKAALQNSVLLNYQWNNVLDKQGIVDEAVRAGVDEGTVFYRVGWESESVQVTERIPVYDYYPTDIITQVQQLQSLAELQQQDPYAFEASVEDHLKEALRLTAEKGQAIYPSLNRYEEVTREKLLKNQPTLEVCNLANVHVDPLAQGNLNKAHFVVYSYETNKSDLSKQGDTYFNLDKLKLDKGSVLSTPDHEFTGDSSANLRDDARINFIVHEYWGYWDVDGSGKTSPIVVSWVGDVIIRMEDNPYPDGEIPFVSNAYIPRRYTIYGDPDGALLRDQQAVIGAITRGAIDSMARSANAQRGMADNALDPINKKRYESGQNYFYRPDTHPTQSVIEHQYPELPNSIGLMLNLQETDVSNLSGVRPYGATDSSAGTATADRGVLDAASKRETGILRRYGRAMQEICRKITAMNAEFLSDEEIIRITDEDHVTIRREELAGNFDFEISIATAEEDDKKAQELAFMLQTMAATLPAKMSNIILADIARLRKMPQLAKRIEDYEPEPDPVAQAMQQLEVAKIQREIAKIESETLKNQTSAQLNVAKAGEAAANAGNIQSSTDSKDLDFVNKQTGLDHAQELEKQQAQSRGNMALEILKQELQPEANQ